MDQFFFQLNLVIRSEDGQYFEREFHDSDGLGHRRENVGKDFLFVRFEILLKFRVLGSVHVGHGFHTVVNYFQRLLVADFQLSLIINHDSEDELRKTTDPVIGILQDLNEHVPDHV